MTAFKEGDRVCWNWGEGSAQGVIAAVYTERVTRVIKGTEVVRNADADTPAYLIEQDDGDEVLKSATEIAPA